MKKIAHNAVIKFIGDNGVGACPDGRYEVTISIDGCYPKRNQYNNYTSIFGITFVICVFTGIILEYYVSERCIDNTCS